MHIANRINKVYKISLLLLSRFLSCQAIIKKAINAHIGICGAIVYILYFQSVEVPEEQYYEYVYDQSLFMFAFFKKKNNYHFPISIQFLLITFISSLELTDLLI